MYILQEIKSDSVINFQSSTMNTLQKETSSTYFSSTASLEWTSAYLFPKTWTWALSTCVHNRFQDIQTEDENQLNVDQ